VDRASVLYHPRRRFRRRWFRGTRLPQRCGRFLGKHELDELLAQRDRLNADIQEILDQQTDAWGIKVTNVEMSISTKT
jgi:hypothetical protein